MFILVLSTSLNNSCYICTNTTIPDGSLKGPE